jgi:curved DNA-binding protein CbpA
MFSKVLRSFNSTTFGKDYYKILGITPKASKAEIRSAYLKLAKQYHPDSPTGSEEKFKNLGEAWSVLGNETKKSEYDAWKEFGGTTSTSNKSNPYTQNKSQNYEYSGWDNKYKKNSTDFQSDFEKFFEELQKHAKPNQYRYTNQQNSYSNYEKKTKKTEYYEYYNPRTGKRVFYTYTTDYKPDDQAYRDKMYENFYSESKQENKYDEEYKPNSFYDIFKGAGFLFFFIVFLSMLSKMTSRKHEYDPRDAYIKPKNRDHVWDEFAKEMDRNRQKTKVKTDS